MVVPAAIFVAFTINAGDGAARGWAIPTATDIAFAVAVLAVISTHLPSALRTFLLTLAVVDDLLAITVIAIFYTEKIKLVPLLVALIPLILFAILVQRRIQSWWLLIPLAAAHLGVRPRVRGARHGGRGAAGLHGAGAAQRGGRRARGGAGAGRALRAPDAAGVGGFRRPGVRLLRRRCHLRRL